MTFARLDSAPTALESTKTSGLMVRGFDAKPFTAAFPWSRFSAQLTPLTLSNVTGRLAAIACKSNGAWQLTVFSYDPDGRIATRWLFTEANGGASVLTNVNTTVTYTRDLRDALTLRQVTVGAGSWYQWYDYDTRGLLWKVSAATTNVKPGTPDVTYTCRPSGAVASRLFSGGTSVPLTYTIREQLAKIGDPATTTSIFTTPLANACGKADRVVGNLDARLMGYAVGFQANGKVRNVPFEGIVAVERAAYPGLTNPLDRISVTGDHFGLLNDQGPALSGLVPALRRVGLR